MFRDLFNLKKN